MELVSTINERTSIREFSTTPIDEKVLEEIVRRGASAPSVNNSQPWKFIVISNEEYLNNMADIVAEKIHKLPTDDNHKCERIKGSVECHSTLFRNAPALIAVTMKQYKSVLEQSGIDHNAINIGRMYPDIQSTGACIENMLLSAVDMGLGACWLSGPLIAKQELERELNVGPDHELIAFVAIGYSASQHSPKNKRPLKDVLTFIN